jgi:[acyl-carrier-protein] S-malonyltransferase
MTTAFLFPGQGAQYVGMAKDLVATRPEARALFDEAATLLGYDLLDLCLNGPADRLNSTAVSQPAIYVASLAALEQLKIDKPDVVANCTRTAGLSLGEYSALTFAGVFSFADGLRLVQKRGAAMQAAADASAGTMLAVLLTDEATLQPLVDAARPLGPVSIANYLCPGNLPLTVAGAFHTELMKPADEQLARALETVALSPPRIPVWSNVDAAPHTDTAEIRALLVRQVVEPVRMEALLRSLFATGTKTFYEIGPGKVLLGLLKRIQRSGDYVGIPA